MVQCKIDKHDSFSAPKWLFDVLKLGHVDSILPVTILCPHLQRFLRGHALNACLVHLCHKTWPFLILQVFRPQLLLANLLGFGIDLITNIHSPPTGSLWAQLYCWYVLIPLSFGTKTDNIIKLSTCHPLILTTKTCYWLVVWKMATIFPYIGNVTIPTDFHAFQRGRYTTNQIETSPSFFEKSVPATTSVFFLQATPGQIFVPSGWWHCTLNLPDTPEAFRGGKVKAFVVIPWA